MSADNAKRVVVKLGTGVLTSGVGQLDTQKMKSICAQIADAKKRGLEIVLVSSGAVGLGMGKLGLKSRPKQIVAVQECAAVAVNASNPASASVMILGAALLPPLSCPFMLLSF